MLCTVIEEISSNETFIWEMNQYVLLFKTNKQTITIWSLYFKLFEYRTKICLRVHSHNSLNVIPWIIVDVLMIETIKKFKMQFFY